MKTGLLYSHIVIERAERIEHEYGGHADRWRTVCSARAFVRSIRGGLGIEQDEVFTGEQIAFEVHYHLHQLVQRYDVVRYGDSRYRIVGLEPHRTQRKLIITAERNNE